MSQSASVGVSPRSFLIAGVSAAVVGAAAVTPVGATGTVPAKIAAAVEMTSITTPLEVAIKNTYNFVEPWAAYGAAWGEYILGLIPGLWWVAPGVPFAYYTTEPLVQAGVYSFADLVGLNFAQIGPDVSAGIDTSINNAATYGLAWLNSLVPFPPLPPIPPLPGATVANTVAAGAAALPAAATDLLAAPQASSATSPIEDAIKNTYNAVEPWVAYGFELSQWALGFVPGLWWIAPGIDFAYFTAEPLVQAGVFALADVIGLDFEQIGPDINTGIQTSINNAITYGLAWVNSLVPLPPFPPFPPLPGASVAADSASVRSAATVETPETAAPDAKDAVAATALAVDDAPAAESTAPAAHSEAVTLAPVTPAAEDAAPTTDDPAATEQAAAEQAEDSAPAADEAGPDTVADDVAPEVAPQVAPQVAEPPTQTAVDATAAGDEAATAGGASSAASDNAERPARATRSAGRS